MPSSVFCILKHDPFALEQAAFPIQSAGEAAEFFVRGQHAMAWNQNRNRVRAARAAHGPDRLGPANRLRDFAVAFRFARGNFPQREKLPRQPAPACPPPAPPTPRPALARPTACAIPPYLFVLPEEIFRSQKSSGKIAQA